MSYIINNCQDMKLPNGKHGIKNVDRETIEWLKTIDIWHGYTNDDDYIQVFIRNMNRLKCRSTNKFS